MVVSQAERDLMELTAAYFAKLFGVTEADLPAACSRAIADSDLRYELPSALIRDEIILRILKHIDSNKPTTVGQHRADIWESCWSENLQRFVDTGLKVESLVPHFITPGLPVRLNRDYALPSSLRCEASVLEVCRAFLFDRFFKEVQSIYEFGCGSGFNLVALSRQMPGKKLYGLDWSKSSNETVNLIRDKLNLDITGQHFDFFDPDPSLKLSRNSAVLTMCALEQVGARHERFMKYLLEQKPEICVNMEPLVELYDEKQLIDHLALCYHKKRGYLEGFLPALESFRLKGLVEILDVRRLFFGSLYHEGYSYVAWRPL